MKHPAFKVICLFGLLAYIIKGETIEKEVSQKEFDNGVEDIVGSMLNNMLSDKILDEIPGGSLIKGVSEDKMDNPFSIFKHLHEMTQSLFEGIEDSMNHHKKAHHRKHKGFLDLAGEPTISISIFKSHTNPDGTMSFKEEHFGGDEEDKEKDEPSSVKIWENKQDDKKEGIVEDEKKEDEGPPEFSDKEVEDLDTVTVEKQENPEKPKEFKAKVLNQSKKPSQNYSLWWWNLLIIFVVVILIGGYLYFQGNGFKWPLNGNSANSSQFDEQTESLKTEGKKPFEIIKRD